MFMADLCYIFIYIIKWFLKSPACFRIHTKYENYFNWSMHTVEQIWQKIYIFVFLKKKHLKVSWSIIAVAAEYSIAVAHP